MHDYVGKNNEILGSGVHKSGMNTCDFPALRPMTLAAGHECENIGCTKEIQNIHRIRGAPSAGFCRIRQYKVKHWDLNATAVHQTKKKKWDSNDRGSSGVRKLKEMSIKRYISGDNLGSCDGYSFNN